jgi:muramoyltetrapeptide carboxypeptidase
MTIGIVTPSSPVRNRATIHAGVSVLEAMGFRVVFGSIPQERRSYTTADDRARADELLSMLARDDVDAVMCVQGGYGGVRTIRWLDPDRLAQLAQRPPKPFIGFSDITWTHVALGRALDCVTFWGPNLAQIGTMTDYTHTAFRRALMESEPFDVPPDPDNPYAETLVPGVAEGELVGGTLRPIVLQTGTPWELDLRGKVLFFEGAAFGPFEADRLLSQMLLAGRLQQCAGIVIGEHVGAPEDDTLRFDEVFDDLIRPLGIPTLYRAPLGHGKHLATVPLGARVRLDATGRTLRVLEPGVI